MQLLVYKEKSGNMRSKGNSQTVYLIYFLIVFSTLTGMLYKFFSTGILRKVYIGSRVLLLACLIFSIILELFSYHKIYKDGLLLSAFVLYELYISKIRGLLIWPDAFIDILIWPLTYLFFKTYTRRNPIPCKFGKFTQISMIFVFTLSIPLVLKHRAGIGDAGGVVFFVYYCITFLPMVLYTVKDYKVKNRLFIVSILMLMLSTKRSGTIVAVIGYIIYIFNDVRVRNDIKNKLKKYQWYIFGIVLVVLLFVVLNSVFSFKIFDRFKNLSSDQGSGREYIWSYILKAFARSEENLKIFGHGFQAVYYRLKPFGVDRLAHNSFLEFLYDYGYAGIFVFSLFYFSLFGKTIKAYRKKDAKIPAMLYTLLISIVFGYTSYFFEESTIIVPIAVYWGCFVGENQRKKYKATNDRIIYRNERGLYGKKSNSKRNRLGGEQAGFQSVTGYIIPKVNVLGKNGPEIRFKKSKVVE